MSEFRAMFTGFTPSFAPADSPARTPEITPMSIISENADRIIQLITDNGGSMSGEKLREELADMEAADRRKAIGKLREERRITSTGATTRVTYYLPGRERNAKSSAPRDQFEVAEEIASRNLAARSNSDTTTCAGDSRDTSSKLLIDPDRRWTVAVPVPLISGTQEVQLLSALDFIADHFAANGLDAAALGRAASWLASKHRSAA